MIARILSPVEPREEPGKEKEGNKMSCQEKMLPKYKQTLTWKCELFDGSARRFEAPCLTDERDEDAGEEDIFFLK